MFKISVLCCQTFLNSLKQILGNFLQFALMNVVNCFRNVLLYRECRLLGCYAVWFLELTRAARRNILNTTFFIATAVKTSNLTKH
jgi:hypothetical protein